MVVLCKSVLPKSFCIASRPSVDPLQDWTPHRLELCLWAMSIATQLQLQLLKDIDVRGSAAGKKCSDSEADQRPTKKLKSA